MLGDFIMALTQIGSLIATQQSQVLIIKL